MLFCNLKVLRVKAHQSFWSRCWISEQKDFRAPCLSLSLSLTLSSSSTLKLTVKLRKPQRWQNTCGLPKWFNLYHCTTIDSNSWQSPQTASVNHLAQCVELALMRGRTLFFSQLSALVHVRNPFFGLNNGRCSCVAYDQCMTLSSNQSLTVTIWYVMTSCEHSLAWLSCLMNSLVEPGERNFHCKHGLVFANKYSIQKRYKRG